MSIFVEKAGILTTVQDIGRDGFRRFGINPNGAMDKRAARLINTLLGDDEREAVLEMHFPAPVLHFERAATVAFGGADFAARINDKPLENWRPHTIQKGERLQFAEKFNGNRAYLAVKGGFAVERWLGSFSTNLRAGVGGFSGRKLKTNDRLFFKQTAKVQDLTVKDNRFPYKISAEMIPLYSRLPTIRVVAGAKFEDLTALSEQRFLKENFTISNSSDRMGFRLNGAPLYLLENREPVSSAVDFGTIQLLPDGQMIILMADHQTSGGYPRIAHVTSNDLPVLAQLGAGDKINFKFVSMREAEDSAVSFEENLNLLRIACSFKNNS